MDKMLNLPTGLATEATVIGVVTMVVGLLISSFIWLVKERKLPDAQGYFWMGVPLFLTGLAVHLGFEYTGWNKWYCQNGHACK